ncbi:unnamed protein product, partial [Ectocarpus sp. 4 AP-2014]
VQALNSREDWKQAGFNRETNSPRQDMRTHEERSLRLCLGLCLCVCVYLSLSLSVSVSVFSLSLRLAWENIPTELCSSFLSKHQLGNRIPQQKRAPFQLQDNSRKHEASHALSGGLISPGRRSPGLQSSPAPSRRRPGH